MLGKGLESLIPNHRHSETTGTEEGINTGDKPRSSHSVPQKKSVRSARSTEDQAVFHIEVEKIKPNPLQPRRDFNNESLKELADSIREFGILHPLVVSKIEKEVAGGTEVEYQLIAGERRLLASKLLGLPRVPVIVRKINAEREGLLMAVIENLQRKDLNPVERARAFSRLQDEFRLTQREIATQLGKSRETVANTLRLLELPTHIQEALSRAEISESHGRLLLAVTDLGVQEKLFRDLVNQHLTTRDLKNRVATVRRGEEKPHLSPQLSPELAMLEEKLSSELGTPVKIEQRGESGKITISFYSGEELKNIVERLGGMEKGT